jgi:hypothetical protein
MLVQQNSDLDALLATQQHRIGALLDHSLDRGATCNTEWMEFLHPFFRDILSVGSITTAAKRVADALTIASAALPPGSAPPHPALQPQLQAQTRAAPSAPAPSGAAAPAAKAAPRPAFIGAPSSAEIVGPRLAVWASPPRNVLCRACSGRLHTFWECPVKIRRGSRRPLPKLRHPGCAGAGRLGRRRAHSSRVRRLEGVPGSSPPRPRSQGAGGAGLLTPGPTHAASPPTSDDGRGRS